MHDITLKSHDIARRYRAYLLDWDVPTLFDTGYDETTDVLFAGIEEIGLEPERVIITHEDPDHVGGLAAVLDRYDVETWAPAGDAEPIRTEWGLEVDHWYDDGDTIGPWEAVHVPGHSPGTSVLVDERERLAVTGDAVFGSDIRGLPPGYLITPPEHHSMDFTAAERSLENLLGYEFDVALVSHGSAVVENASDKLEQYVDFPHL